MSAPRVAQRRQVDREHVEPVVEVFAQRAARRPPSVRSRLIAAMIRTSASIGSLPPDAHGSLPDSSTRKSFTCSSGAHLGDLVEQQRSARRAFEVAECGACRRPVKLPFSWPNSSLSIRFGETAPQFTANMRCSLRPRQLVDRLARPAPCRCRSRRAIEHGWPWSARRARSGCRPPASAPTSRPACRTGRAGAAASAGRELALEAAHPRDVRERAGQARQGRTASVR